MSEKDFKFHIPAELIKGDTEDSWKIKGIASTQDPDLQGEVVDQTGLDISALKAGKGLFNWDHGKGPENVIGQIEDAEFKKIDGKTALEVEGYLFNHQDKAKAVYNVLKSLKKGNGPRLHMSIEGKILERDFQDQKKIKKARIDKVALTFDPVNPYTFAQLCKSLASEEVEEVPPESPKEDLIQLTRDELKEIIGDAVKKALAAGAGGALAPSARQGGEAMTKESMDKCGEPKSVTYMDKAKKSKKVIKSFIEGLVETHPNETPEILSKWVLDALNKKESQSD